MSWKTKIVDAVAEMFDDDVAKLAVAKSVQNRAARDAKTAAAAAPRTAPQAPRRVPATAKKPAPRVRAYHGSPKSFKRFDIAHAGTGTGESARGHGLYFSNDEEIAKNYRDFLSDWDVPIRIGRTDADYILANRFPDPVVKNAAELLQMYDGDIGGALQAFGGQTDSAGWAHRLLNGDNQLDQQVEKLLQKWRADDAVLPLKSTGHMYEVDIMADPEQMLHWDAEMYKQPRVVDALAPLTQKYELNDLIDPSHRFPGAGADYYNTLRRRGLSKEGTSAALREHGVPALRYLDPDRKYDTPGASTAENYVTFGDDLIKLIRKYQHGGLVE